MNQGARLLEPGLPAENRRRRMTDHTIVVNAQPPAPDKRAFEGILE
jgi:hypothetical protein